MLQYQIIPVTAFQQNCTLLWCDETHEAALIDPGGDIEKLLQAIGKNNLTLTKLLLTHGHLDHVGAADKLRKRTGCPIIGPHQADAFWLNALPAQSEMFGFAHTDVSHRITGSQKLKPCQLAIWNCRCCIALGTRQAMWCSITQQANWRSSVMCCLTVLSAGQISRKETIPT